MTINQTISVSPTPAPRVLPGLPDIAFVGKAGAGKTTSAEFLAHDLGYKRRSFAAPLKRIAADLWGSDAEADRSKLQKLGVAVREIDPDTWVNLLVQGLKIQEFGQLGPRPPVVVDDLRFENEWFALKGEGFVIVRIGAPRSSRIDRLKSNGKWQSEEQLDHVSETAVDHLEADYTIENDATGNSLADKVIDILVRERKRR